MKTIGWLLLVFGNVVLCQLAVPIGMIYQQENILRTGIVYKFHTQPVDPYDAFRGRYVSLALLPNQIEAPELNSDQYPTVLYVTLGTDGEGFAKFTDISSDPPRSGDYLRVEAWSSYEGNVRINLPFNRYYMEEYKAPAAEIAYREYSRPDQSDAYVSVRVKGGRGVIEELYIAGKPIQEFLRNPPPSKPDQATTEPVDIP